MSTSVLFWKEEPVSPQSYYDEASLCQDATFYQTALEQFANDVKLEGDEDNLLDTCESKAEYASHLLENLENLMDLDDLIKEEPFLLDEKMVGGFLVEGFLEGVDPPQAVQVVGIQDMKTEYVPNEFEIIYDTGVELVPHPNTLTPPQSPPSGGQTLGLTALQPVIYSERQPPFSQDLSGIAYNQPTYQAPPEDVIAQELAVVDELVRSRVEDMQWSNSSCNSNSSSPGSPGDSSSSYGDCSSSSEDPEWVPSDLSSREELAPAKASSRKRRSYTKGAPEEKKVRKKEQNKNAATRYRMKKKAEVEEVLMEEKKVLEQNTELKGKITDLEREIKYLKGLMRDLFKAKGLIN